MKKVYFIYLLSFLFFSKLYSQSIINPNDTLVTYNPSAPPAQPAYGQIGKWVRTVKLSWNTSEYKSYIYKGCPFRVHFPKTYNPTANDGKKYPMLVFFHGLGEADTSIYDNEYQLYHGGTNFQDAVDSGVYDGYVFFMQSQSFWGSNYYQAISEIIDYMITNNKLDPFAVSVNGLSAGGQGTWEMMFSHISYVAADIPMSSISISYTNSDTINKIKFTPVWDIQGGLDGSPAPYTAHIVRDSMLAKGANLTYTEYPTQGHDTWDSTWLQPIFYTYINNAYSANPWTLFGRTKFCPGDSINVTIGLAPGYQAYQWRRNDTLISNLTNSIQVTQTGTYDARVERNGIWSDWSRTPVQIIVQSPSQTPPIQVAGLMSTALPSADGRNYVNLQVSGINNYTNYTWKKVGSDSIYSTAAIFKATQPGYYTVAALPLYGCTALYSPSFKVINANGINAPALVKSLVANALSNTVIQLSWSKPSQQANAPTAFEIYRGTVSGVYSFIGQVAPSLNSFTDSGAAPKTKYYYTIRSIDSTAAAPLSSVTSVSTFSDTIAPTIPLNLKTVYTTISSISISWSASTDNVAVDHYNIYINGTLSNISKNTSFTLTGLVQSTPYAICVKAVDASNNISLKSNQITAEPILGGLQYSYYGQNTPWKILPDFESLTPTSTGVVKNITLSVATQPINFGIVWQGYLQVPVSGTYTFQTTSDDGSAFWFNTYTPTGKRLVNNDGAHGIVSKRATINITAGIYPVCIEYFQSSGGESMTLSWGCTTLFGDTAQHTIANNYFNGTYVNSGSVPSIPTNVKATAVAYNKINLSWTDNSSNEGGFEIYRSTTLTGIYNLITTAATNATLFVDSSLAPATKYYYKIQAINKYGNSGLTTVDSVTANGIGFNYYIGNFTAVPNFNLFTPVTTGMASNFILTGASGNGYGFLFLGQIKIATAGTYTFYTTSDNGSNLYIDGYSGNNAVLKNVYSSTTHEQSGTVTLSRGIHSIFVSYYFNKTGNTGNALLNTSYSGPGISKQAIPDSVLTYKTLAPYAVTYAIPAAPDTPTNFIANAISASKIALSWSTVTSATGYQLLRSIGDTDNYNLLTTLASSATLFTDTNLNANLIHYYKLKSAGIGGAYSASVTANATTKNTAPDIKNISSTIIAFATSQTIAVNASDSDGDVLSYTTRNLPAFGSLINNSNGVNLIFNPAYSDIGTYNNVTVIVTDPYGGTDSTVFKLTVNNNYIPVIDTIANYTMNENDTLSLYLNATDKNSGDSLTWSASNMPSNYVLKNLGGGKAKLFLHPTYLAAGTYNPIVTVNDGNGGITSRTFNLVVDDVNPNTNIYIRFLYTDSIGKPWNNITSTATNHFTDFMGNPTNIGLALQTSWFAANNSGPTTGNNSGVYPDAVLKDYYYFGIFGGPQTVDTKITGLIPSRLYNLTFFGASNFPGAADNGSTIYTVGSKSDTLEVQNNTKNTAIISNVKAASDGTILYTMSKDTNAQAGYINALLISSIYNDGTAPAAPTVLTAQNISASVQLSWNDIAYNETGYNIYRALASNSIYSLIGTTQSETTSYTDTSIIGNTKYLYKIAAVNTNGVSAYSNIVTITTPDKAPKLNAIADVILKNNQTSSVNIIAIDDSADYVTLSVSGLPTFATFTNNGNGKGTINVNPTINNLGNYIVTVTSEDMSDSIVSTVFNILVTDPNVSSTYLSFSDGAHNLPMPWNLIGPYPVAGASFNNIKDDSNAPTGITLTFKNGFQGVIESGMQPVEGVGIYPNVIMRTADYEGTSNMDTIQLSGLSASKMYNFVFFNSHDDGLNGTTNFTIGTKTVTLNATDNLIRTIQINGITPDTSGIVNIIVSKNTGADYAFISTLVIQSYAPSYTNLTPTNLRTTNITRNAISLVWQDRANTETGYQIWRAADSSGSYTLVATVGASVKTYTDANLSSNKTYTYSVRGVFGSTYSNFSNTLTATTYSYNVYLNYTLSNDAGLPWNNLDALPQNGYSWNNFFDDKGVITGTGMQLTTDWAGLYSAGVNGMDKGIYPNVVMIDSYGLYPGQTGILQVTGLNLNMKYDFTFYASSQAYGDVNVAYTINGVTTLLNASLNVNGAQTIYGVTPDNYGNVTISIAAGTPTSQFGLIGALVIGAYTPSASGIVPTLPSSSGSNTAIAGVSTNQQKSTAINLYKIEAFPNPFHNYFTLSTSSKSTISKIQVVMYDVSGKVVYSNQFGLTPGRSNTLKITTGNTLTSGIYTANIIDVDTKQTKTIRLVKY